MHVYFIFFKTWPKREDGQVLISASLIIENNNNNIKKKRHLTSRRTERKHRTSFNFISSSDGEKNLQRDKNGEIIRKQVFFLLQGKQQKTAQIQVLI